MTRYYSMTVITCLGFMMGMFGLSGSFHMDCINDYQGVSQVSCETVKNQKQYLFTGVMIFFTIFGFSLLYYYSNIDKSDIQSKYSKQPIGRNEIE